MWPLGVVESDPVFDHAFGLVPVLQFMQTKSLLFEGYTASDQLTEHSDWGARLVSDKGSSLPADCHNSRAKL